MCPVYRGVAQLVRAPVLGTGGRLFEPDCPDRNYLLVSKLAVIPNG